MPENITEVTKPTLEVGIISLLTVLALKLAPAGWREVATSVAPLLGGSIAYAIRAFRKSRNHKALVALETQWIDELVAKCNEAGITARELKTLQADIKARQLSLQQLQRNNLRIE